MRTQAARAHVFAMTTVGALLTITCAVAAAASNIDLNNTNIDNNVIKRIVTVLNSNRTLNSREFALLNRTAVNLGIESEMLTKLTSLVKQTYEQPNRDTASYAYEEGNKGSLPVEESPDYASSVVLASDLLSLTSAVANVKENVCREQGYKFLDGLLLNKRWALKMFDASAKSPQGLLFGSSFHLGNFDECLAIEDQVDDGTVVYGQYCLANIKWRRSEAHKKVRTGRGETLRWAICVPRVCDANAVQQFVSDVLSHTVGNTTTVQVTDRDCYTKQPLTVNSLDVAFLSLIFLFVAILIMSTSYEIYCIQWKRKRVSTIHDIITSFSIINNMKKILSTKQNNSLGLESITGIKVLAMIFIISGHASLFISVGPVMDAEAFDRILRNPANAFMENNMILVDTFLFLGAFLFSRILLPELDKRRGRLNILPILLFRYLRVTPAYAVVILFYMTWFPKIGDGPLWESKMRLEQDRCLESWWANILYVNNYVNTDKMCMFQSWYLSVDTQLFFFAPIFIFALWKWRRFGPMLLGVGLLISLLIPAVITYTRRLDPTLLLFAKEFSDLISNFYFKEAYIKTHMKITTYLMGLLTGYILHRIQKENYQMSRSLKVFGWITSIILGTVTTFSVSLFYQEWYQYNAIEAAAYISLHKLAWSIANGWMIIACVTGNGGILAKLFNWKLFVPLSRLTYCAYLVNGIVELFYIGQLRHPAHLTVLTVTANSISHLVLTFFLALLLCITFESPIHGIEKILLKKFVGPRASDNTREDKSQECSRSTSQSKLES
ncbi:nose resistant to fluoxetine protein 6-like [Galleria mellonella]|uniref:Nose resistant to fluoxetine protein 6-like n=1 Tax=Galleria mellonella TaxID=7137 RepID=A0ABM3MJM7_GALME|nr:nose resistant to fluoxetine protein 6-like [Galleria mellonella]